MEQNSFLWFHFQVCSIFNRLNFIFSRESVTISPELSRIWILNRFSSFCCALNGVSPVHCYCDKRNESCWNRLLFPSTLHKSLNNVKEEKEWNKLILWFFFTTTCKSRVESKLWCSVTVQSKRIIKRLHPNSLDFTLIPFILFSSGDTDQHIPKPPFSRRSCAIINFFLESQSSYCVHHCTYS